MKRYTHPLTKELTPDNWKDKINLDDLSLDDLSSLLGDLKAMEALGKKIGGFIKEIVKSRMPEGEDEYDGPHFFIQRNFRVREGGLNAQLIEEEMGEEWVEDHRKTPTEYEEIRCTRKEDT